MFPINCYGMLLRRSFRSLRLAMPSCSFREKGTYPCSAQPVQKMASQRLMNYFSHTPICSTHRLAMSAQGIHTSNRTQGLEDTRTKALTFWTNLRELKRSPFPALILGFSGLVPFLAVPAYMIFSQTYLADLAFVQVAYGATTLSFIGGVRWGFTLPEDNPVHPNWFNLGYSVMPSLIAWGGLLFPSPLSIFTLMGGLTFVTYMDMAMYGYPSWFKGLRFILSFIAVLSLWTTFMCSLMLKGTKQPHNSQSH